VVAKTDRAVKPKRAFHIKKRESVAAGVSRAIGEQLHGACEQLNSDPESIDEGVHEARKALKKSRALLRLIRPALGHDYNVLNTELRDAGRHLSVLRDTEALAETAQRLKKQSGDTSVHRVLDETRRNLLERKKQILDEFMTRDELANSAKNLDGIAARIAALKMGQATPATMVEGVAETVRRGRKAFARAQGSGQADDFHEWRKRAKDLRYQISFLEELWPHVLEGYSESARDLEQSLGEDHNVSVVRGMLTAGGIKRELNPVLAILDAEQQRLRRQAGRMGSLLYAEKPKQWAKRIALCWDHH
jgi:CHAD domain-containing protein